MPGKRKNSGQTRALETDTVKLAVNGQEYELAVGGRSAEVEPWHSLSHTLRETLGLTGTKVSCDEGACGACTVIMDGKAVLSCKLLTVECDGRSITTMRRSAHGEGIVSP